jgi:hypothetical protein
MKQEKFCYDSPPNSVYCRDTIDFSCKHKMEEGYCTNVSSNSCLKIQITQCLDPIDYKCMVINQKICRDIKNYLCIIILGEIC